MVFIWSAVTRVCMSIRLNPPCFRGGNKLDVGGWNLRFRQINWWVGRANNLVTAVGDIYLEARW